jgi:hypothetical protein
MRRPSPPVLEGLSLSSRLRTFTGLCVALAIVVAGTRALAADNAWVKAGDINGLVDSNLAETYANGCDGVVGIPFGTSPGWVRVGGSTDPHTPIVGLTDIARRSPSRRSSALRSTSPRLSVYAVWMA